MLSYIKQGTTAAGIDTTDYNHIRIDSRMVKDLREFITNKQGTADEANLALLYDYFTGLQSKESLPFDVRQHVETLIAIHQSIGLMDQNGKEVAEGYQKIVGQQLFEKENQLVDRGSVSNDIKQEIKEKFDKNTFTKKMLDKLPKQLSFLKDMKAVHKAVGALYDGYLIAQSLTGKTDSLLRKVFYDSLDHATGEFQETQNNFKSVFSIADSAGKYANWGTADVAAKTLLGRDQRSLEDYETYDIVDENGKPVKLTMSEATTLYLNLIQEDTAKAIMDNGIYLDETDIKGRDVSYNQVIKISPESRAQLIKDFQTNPDYVEAVKAVQRTMNYLYERVNPTFTQLNGYNLEQRENYFPAYYGKQSLNQRKEKNAIEQFKANHARMGGTIPVRIGDFKKITNNHAVASAMYGAYAIPIRNNRLVLADLRNDFADNKVISQRLGMVEGMLNKLEDPTLLYSSQGEKARTRLINEAMSNFTIYTLGYNKFVVIKQTASYMAAKEFIDGKYLKEAGFGIGPLMVPKLRPFFQALKQVKNKEDVDTIRRLIPIEYRLDESNETYNEIMQNSERLRYRFEGHHDRELSEAIMSMSQGKDKIEVKVPGLKKPIVFSKTRAMEGIRVMDAVTIMSIWNAVKSETNDEIGMGTYNFEVGSPEYWEHVAKRAEFIINRSQPTSDIINRSELSTEKGNIARGLTMFSSATQKMGQLLISKMMEYNNNPTQENLKALGKTMANVGFMTAFYVTAIDMIKSMLMGYMDDDEPEEYLKFTTYNMINNMAGYFHVMGTFTRLVTSRIDDQPWTATTQHPLEALVDDTADAFANGFKGNWGKSAKGFFELWAQTKGVPAFPFKTPMTLHKNYFTPEKDSKKK
jgi:hypothetical protein